MSRDYCAFSLTKRGFRRLSGENWNVNVWGSTFYGYLFSRLGAEDNVEDGGSYISLPHFFIGKGFQKTRDVFQKVTDAELKEAFIYALEVMAYTPPEGVDEWVKDFRETVIPMFLKKKAFGVCSDYCDLPDYYKSYVAEKTSAPAMVLDERIKDLPQIKDREWPTLYFCSGRCQFLYGINRESREYTYGKERVKHTDLPPGRLCYKCHELIVSKE